MSSNEDRNGRYDETPNYGKTRTQPFEEVSSITGLRKTNYSENLYGSDKKPTLSFLDKRQSSITPPMSLDKNDSPSKSLQKSATSTKIPQSPVLTRRRLSIENLSPKNRSRSASYDRSMNREKSMTRESPSPVKRPLPGAKSKDASSKPPTVPANSPTGNSVGSFGRSAGSRTVSPSGNNTWNGRSPAPKGKTRPAINNETFVTPNGKTHPNKVASPPFQRNTNLRSSTTALRNMNGYDHNGRKIKGSPNSSPIKTNKQRSPLIEKILKSAENVEDDTAVLETLKKIIKNYSDTNNATKNGLSKVVNDESAVSDFTRDWVHTNGTLERSQSSSGLIVDSEDSSGLKSAALVSKIPMFTPRKDPKAGITSRIPAPISTASYKKSDYYD